MSIPGTLPYLREAILLEVTVCSQSSGMLERTEFCYQQRKMGLSNACISTHLGQFVYLQYEDLVASGLFTLVLTHLKDMAHTFLGQMYK